MSASSEHKFPVRVNALVMSLGTWRFGVQSLTRWPKNRILR